MDKADLFVKLASLAFFVMAILGGTFSLVGTLDAYFMAPVLLILDFFSRLNAIHEYFTMLSAMAFFLLIFTLARAEIISWSQVNAGFRFAGLFLLSGAISMIAAIVIAALMIRFGIESYGIFLFLSAFVLVFGTEIFGMFRKPK